MALAWVSFPNEEAGAITGASVAASAEDPAYLQENLLTEDASNPAGLTTPSGNWVVDLGTAKTIYAAAVIYHNFDDALSGVSIDMDSSSGFGGGFTQPIVIPNKWEDGWTVSPYTVFDTSQTYRYVRLRVTGTNSVNLQVGRLWLATAIHEIPFAKTPTEEEEHHDIYTETEGGFETVYSIGGKRRRLRGDLIVGETVADTLLALRRSAEGRRRCFLMAPFPGKNDAYYLRMTDATGSRTFTDPKVQTHPFSAREHARGVPFP